MPTTWRAYSTRFAAWGELAECRSAPSRSCGTSRGVSPPSRSRSELTCSGTDVPQDVLVAWSGGKDSALALREILGDPRYRVAALLTTVTAEYDRISIHGVRRTLLRRQTESLGLPLAEVSISPGASNDEYEANMAEALAALRAGTPGLDTVVFGDLFLADIRAYRE